MTALGRSWNGAQECVVELEHTDASASGRLTALAYTELVGTPQVGSPVLLSMATLARGLGTGGYAMIVALPENLPPAPRDPSPGHIVKARYTPLQYMTLGVDEQESPWHSTLAEATSLEGMLVISADLHSALPAVVCAILAECPQARIAYIMDDGGALPAWFSRACATLREEKMILGTITARQAFGGDLEAVNIHTALLAARHVWKADIAIVSQGPGNLGTETPWGFSGTSVGEVVNATNTLSGRAVGLLRMSDADPRERHRGISHHSMTALGRVALTPVVCPTPALDGDPLASSVSRDVREKVAVQLEELGHCEHIEVCTVDMSGMTEILEASPVRLSTMGRGLREDPLSFLAAGAAGRYAASVLRRSTAEGTDRNDAPRV